MQEQRLIDANALEKLVSEEYPKNGNWAYCEFMGAIRQAPTITTRTGWTPCAEGLPEEYGEYWVTVDPCNAVVGNQPIRAYKCQFSKELGWETERFYHKVIAWMPTENQPEPYNPDHIRDATKKMQEETNG